MNTSGTPIYLIMEQLFSFKSAKAIFFSVLINGLICLTAYAGGGPGPGGANPQGPSSNTNAAAPGAGAAASTSLGGTMLAYQSLKAIGVTIGERTSEYIVPAAAKRKPDQQNGLVYITTVAPNNSGLQASYFFDKVSNSKNMTFAHDDNTGLDMSQGRTESKFNNQ